ncbi:hypothetical protein Ddc_16908 [Ditylenchus destructor]|nr:hypothetical protein Ddc_16908 [Ditylenchus destructor]
MELYKILLVSFLITAKCAEEEKLVAVPTGKTGVTTKIDDFKKLNPSCGKDCPGIWGKETKKITEVKKKITKAKCDDERKLLECLEKDTTCSKVEKGLQRKYMERKAFIKVCKGVRVSAIDLGISFLLIFLVVLVANVL